MVAHVAHAQKVTTVSECVAPQAATHAGVLCVVTVATMTYAAPVEDGYVAGYPLVLPARVTFGSDTTCTLGTVDL